MEEKEIKCNFFLIYINFSYNDFLMYDLYQENWQKIEIKGHIPSGRYGHTM